MNWLDIGAAGIPTARSHRAAALHPGSGVLRWQASRQPPQCCVPRPASPGHRDTPYDKHRRRAHIGGAFDCSLERLLIGVGLRPRARMQPGSHDENWKPAPAKAKAGQSPRLSDATQVAATEREENRWQKRRGTCLKLQTTCQSTFSIDFPMGEAKEKQTRATPWERVYCRSTDYRFGC